MGFCVSKLSALSIIYSVVVEQGPNINKYMLTDAEFQNLQDGEDFQAIDGTTWPDSSSVEGATVTLDAGTYWLVMINADIEPVN